MKVVLDANVVVAAFATQGLCWGLFELCLEKHRLVFSEELLREIHDALRQKIKLPAQETEKVVAFLKHTAQMVSVQSVPSGLCRDPDDAKVLGTALAGDADVLVTGDKDLLSLEKFQGISILSPRTFWNRSQKAE